MTTKEMWKPVTISGVTGILMGAGTVYAANSVATGDEQGAGGEEQVPNGLKVATVSDDLSFAKAFEAARAEVGSGGVFSWRGHIYNTYTEAEWKAMSTDEKNLFAQQVKPEVSLADVDTSQLEEQSQPATDEVQAAKQEPEPEDADVRVTEEPKEGIDSWNEIAQEDNDVRVLGFKEIEIGRGRSIAMQELDINGQRVAVIDVDKDGTPDLAMSDLNHNHQMDEGEVIDLQTGETVSFANDEHVVPDTPDINSFTI